MRIIHLKFEKYIFIGLLLSLFSFTHSDLIAQVSQDENEIKSNFIFRLAEYFNWPRENTMGEFVIALFDDDTRLYPHLLNLSVNKKINDKPVVIRKIKSLSDLAHVNILYIDPARSVNSSRYYAGVMGKNILLITDLSETTNDIMINLIVTKEKRLSFEINKKNLEANKFNVPSDLLVLGGSQLEIKAMFDETQRNLKQIQDKVRQQQDEIENQKKIISGQQAQVENQKHTITRQNNEITEQKNIYNKLKRDIDSTVLILNNENRKIDEQQKNISLRDEIIREQESKINSQITILAKQIAEIDEGKQQIENQKLAIREQGAEINTQRVIIILSVLFLLILIVLTVIILRINRKNKKINWQLSEKNSEIETQKLILEDQKRQLEISNKEIESFSYSVSHDLRAPLRVIDGYSNIMLNDSQNLNDESKEFLAKIIASSRKMAILIDDMLRLAKVTRQTLIKETFNLSIMAKDIIEELLANNPNRKIEIILPDGIITEGDPHLLRIALQNLLDNAFKFTSKIPDPVIGIGVMKEGNKDIFFIKDNGAGFDMQDASRLFQAFHRLHDSKDFPGTGIGLTVVQRIIKRHGGNVWMDSHTGKGTTVFFTLS